METVRKNFNPRSHKGSDKGDVSVVLPAGDFNPRSHKGSDRSWPASRRGSETNFNPRSHKGSDPSWKDAVHKWNISIHAPTRGATICHTIYASIHGHFNPRSHKGSDNFIVLIYSLIYCISIHAPTRGATGVAACPWYGLDNFNPRSHKGSDGLCPGRDQADHISIHAPTRGATY